MRPVKDNSEEHSSTHSAKQKFKDEKERTGTYVNAAPYTHSTSPSAGDRKGRGDRTDTPLVLNTSMAGTAPPTTHNPLANMSTSSPVSSPPPSSSASSSTANTNNFTGDQSRDSLVPSSPQGTKDTANDASAPDLNQPIPFAMNETHGTTYPDPDSVAETILEPVHAELKKLSSLGSPDTYPKGNGFLKIKPHGQLLKERLFPIGEFIRKYAEGNGALDLRLW